MKALSALTLYEQLKQAGRLPAHLKDAAGETNSEREPPLQQTGQTVQLGGAGAVGPVGAEGNSKLAGNRRKQPQPILTHVLTPLSAARRSNNSADAADAAVAGTEPEPEPEPRTGSVRRATSSGTSVSSIASNISKQVCPRQPPNLTL